MRRAQAIEPLPPPITRQPQAAEVGLVKSVVPRAHELERCRRQFRWRSVLFAIALASTWIVVLVDPDIGPMVLFALGAFGVTLGIIGAAMGLGLLGFGLCTSVDRFIGWLRRISNWPDD
jgi:hypothetical protein